MRQCSSNRRRQRNELNYTPTVIAMCGKQRSTPLKRRGVIDLVSYLISFEILLFYLEQNVYTQQRRAESPIGNQPRAAPWVTVNKVICALKEQKDGTRISLAPVALTARWIVGTLVPRVLPWAVFLLGLRPVLAHYISCYAMLWDYHFVETSPRPCSLHQLLCFGVIILWKLRPVLAYNINCYITPWTYHHAESC